MSYLNWNQLNALDRHSFQAQLPYPWINPEGGLTPDGYQRLLETLPDVSLFTPLFGVRRAHGQQSHDRYGLEYSPNLALSEPWQAFINELKSKDYLNFLKDMLGSRWLGLRFHWHYTPNGCSVSPHCDNKQKLGSHIFYFNTEQDWDPAWGGETLILDDGGRFNRNSAPQFNDFDRIISSQALGNRSLLFARKGQSWHGVREIQCPDDQLRKVFIVVINRVTPVDRVKRFFGGKTRSSIRKNAKGHFSFII